MDDAIVNKVSESGILSLDPEALLPNPPVAVIDFTDLLWQGLALREADLREWVKTHDFEAYRNHVVGVFCSTDALIPMWAYMLVTSKLTGVALHVVQGDAERAMEDYLLAYIRTIDPHAYTDLRVVVKGCSKRVLPASVYIALTMQLQGVVKTWMFGEPCSTVPVYKQARKS
jgi:hypothetical protein